MAQVSLSLCSLSMSLCLLCPSPSVSAVRSVSCVLSLCLPYGSLDLCVPLSVVSLSVSLLSLSMSLICLLPALSSPRVLLSPLTSVSSLHRELPEPVIPLNLYKEFIRVMRKKTVHTHTASFFLSFSLLGYQFAFLGECREENQWKAATKGLLMCLPPENRQEKVLRRFNITADPILTSLGGSCSVSLRFSSWSRRTATRTE